MNILKQLMLLLALTAPLSSFARTERIAVKDVEFEMIAVKGGEFMMGSDDGDHDEQPIHAETVGDFMIGKTEVTQQLWMAVMGYNPSIFGGPDLPVTKVSWYEVQVFLNRLNRLTFRQFRLPTEAEWEYAARGGHKSKSYKYSGGDNPDKVAWYGDMDGRPQPVGTKKANELGIHDMSGNVWEWTEDIYNSNYSIEPDTEYRVIRGGCCLAIDYDCRSTYRFFNYPGQGFLDLGFRLAL